MSLAPKISLLFPEKVLKFSSSLLQHLKVCNDNFNCKRKLLQINTVAKPFAKFNTQQQICMYALRVSCALRKHKTTTQILQVKKVAQKILP